MTDELMEWFYVRGWRVEAKHHITDEVRVTVLKQHPVRRRGYGSSLTAALLDAQEAVESYEAGK